MQYVNKPTSSLFVRVNAKAIKKDFILRIAVHNFFEFNSTKALYISDVVNITTMQQLDAYLLTLCKRFNYVNYCIVNNPYSALAKVATKK
jgi:hypothetical protein